MQRTKILILILVLLGLPFLFSNEQKGDSEFEVWKKKFGVQYINEFENRYRQRVFLENLRKIKEHNSDIHRTYDRGLTRFAAMTQKQFAEVYLNLRVPLNQQTQDLDCLDSVRGVSVDWISKGFVTPIKDQGSCGSCYSFSCTGGLQGLSKSEGQLQSFSQSMILDCSDKYGNAGCNGGFATNAYNFVKDHGIATEQEYPYKDSQRSCSMEKGNFKISGHIEAKTCVSLANALQGRPISVAVDATTWGSYIAGIFSGQGCGPYHNHAVLVVGMTDDYWHIKNSWGIHWGQKGYMRLKRGNTCGICLHGSYPRK